MKKSHIFIIFCTSILLIPSCTPAVKLITGLRDPEVVTIKTVEDYINETELYESETYYLDVTKEKIFKDTSLFNEYLNNIIFAFNSDPIVFDSLGNRLKYMSNASCGGTRLKQCYDSLEYYYKQPESAFNDFNNLDELCNRLQTNEGNKVTSDMFPKTDYYIIQSWNIFMQSKKRMKDDFQWYRSMQDASKYNFHIININTNLLENWGLKKGAKFKINKKVNLDKLLDKRWGRTE